jgi:hypothetical protein
VTPALRFLDVTNIVQSFADFYQSKDSTLGTTVTGVTGVVSVVLVVEVLAFITIGSMRYLPRPVLV